MKNAWRVIVPTLASLVLGLAAAVWAEPTTTTGNDAFDSSGGAGCTDTVRVRENCLGKERFFHSGRGIAGAGAE